MKRLIYFLLAILGLGSISSCGETNNADDVVCEYGCPHAEYKINARVVDSEGNPIKGIKASVSEDPDFMYENLNLITTETNDQGELNESEFTAITYYDHLIMRVEDVDGEENGGEFESKDLELKEYITEDSKVEEGSGWYRGRYELNVGDIQLERKSTELNGGENE